MSGNKTRQVYTISTASKNAVKTIFSTEEPWAYRRSAMNMTSTVGALKAREECSPPPKWSKHALQITVYVKNTEEE